MPLIAFFLIFVIYLVFSTYLFLISTDGWTGLFYLLFVTPTFFLTILILLVLVLRKYKNGPKYVTFKVSLPLVLLFVIQFFAVLFNYADCGDSPSSYHFYHTFFESRDVLCDQGFRGESGVSQLLLLGFFVLLILNFSLVSKTAKDKTNQENLAKS